MDVAGEFVFERRLPHRDHRREFFHARKAHAANLYADRGGAGRGVQVGRSRWSISGLVRPPPLIPRTRNPDLLADAGPPKRTSGESEPNGRNCCRERLPGDDLAGGLAGRRSAERFERYRERRRYRPGQQVCGTLSCTGWPAAIRPMMPVCRLRGSASNSIERLSAVSSDAGTIVRLRPSVPMAATKFGWLVLRPVKVASSGTRGVCVRSHADIDQRGEARGRDG